jgi:hypothetical protein
MRKILSLLLLAALVAVPSYAALSKQRAVPVNSSTAVFVGRGVTVGGEACGAAVDVNTVTLGSTAVATNDLYNGLDITIFNCSSADADGTYFVTDYVGASKQASITPASTAAADPNCSVSVGPGLPAQVTEICFGGSAGSVYWSQTIAGTARTDRGKLTGGQWRCLVPENPQELVYLEFLSVSATDTVYVDAR